MKNALENTTPCVFGLLHFLASGSWGFVTEDNLQGGSQTSNSDAVASNATQEHSRTTNTKVQHDATQEMNNPNATVRNTTRRNMETQHNNKT